MKKVFIGVIVLSILLTIPSVFQRVQIEEAAKEYEVIIPYNIVSQWIEKNPSVDQETLLEELAAAGVRSISIEPDTIRTLENKGEISVISTNRLREHLLVNQLEPLDDFFDRQGLFIHRSGDINFEQIAGELFEETRSTTINEVDYVFVPGAEETTLSTSTGYNEENIEDILNAGLNVVPRVSNISSENELDKLIDQLDSLHNENTDQVLFSGQQIPGYPDIPQLKEYMTQLHDAGYSIFNIEFAAQQGFLQAAYTMDLDVTRLHSVGLTEAEPSIISERITRAIKERNMRAIFINMSNVDLNEEPSVVIDELEAVLTASAEGLSQFSPGDQTQFEKFEAAKWQLASALIGAIAFLAYAAEVLFKSRRFTFIGTAAASLMAATYLFLEISLILKVFALALAITAPVLAVLMNKETASKWYLIKDYLKAVIVTLTGTWLIVVLLNGSQFILGIDAFRGVTLVYSVPIAIVIVYVYWENRRGILTSAVKYWHLLLIGLAGAIAFYYIMRTGNSGTVSELELQARVLLEQMLYVRPRTKEFLLGFPFFIFALYIIRSYGKIGYFLLVPSVIGFLSMVNTFTHLHIPLSISLLRTTYSLVLGFFFGLVLIYLYKWIGKRVFSILKARWQG